MKYFLILPFALSSLINLNSQDYFWIGGAGTWTDVSHWATTSGGDVTHATFPDSINDVYFDEHSFLMNKDEVFLDQDSLSCRSLTISGTDLNPEFTRENYYIKFFIHGNISISTPISWQVVNNYLVSDQNALISIREDHFAGSLIINPVDSMTLYELDHDLSVTDLQVFNGRFDTKGFNLDLFKLSIGNVQKSGAPYFYFNDSEIFTPRFAVHGKGLIDAGTSKIHMYGLSGSATSTFFGGDNDFYQIFFEGQIDRIKGNNYFEEFHALPSSTLFLEDGDTQSAGLFNFQGSSSGPIKLLSREAGLAGYISQESGVVDGNYLILEDNEAKGGANFNAYNSIDNGNVEGWNIEETVSEDYYWVGNSGLWSDLSHWARSSGGTDFHVELPSAIDDVYFDANSMDEDGGKVSIDLEFILVNKLSLAGLKSETELSVVPGMDSKISFYSDVTLGSNLKLGLREVDFISDSIQNITSHGSSFGPGTLLRFPASAEIELKDDLEAGEITISGGKFNSNGHKITTFNEFRITSLDDPVVVLDDSQLYVGSWIPSGSGIELSMNKTFISCYFIFYGRGLHYDNVELTGRNWVYGPFYSDELEFKEGSEILIFPGDTVKFGNLTAVGSETDSILIASREPGNHAFLYSEDGEVTGDFLIIKDNHAIGGAVFKANNSNIDENSVTGWTELFSASEVIEFGNNLAYPNPCDMQLLIPLNGGKVRKLNVYNSSGQLVDLRTDMDFTNNKLRINTESWNEGIYYFISDDHKTISSRVVVQH